MSTPDKTLFRVRVSRRKGITPSQHMAFIKEAIAKYKAGMFPGDPFFNYTMEDVEVFGRRRREILGYALVCFHDESFPRYYKTEASAQSAREALPALPPIHMVALIATELRD